MPGLVKIGLTTKAPQTRALKLFTTGVPCEFQIEWFWKVPQEQLSKIESSIHASLDQWRYNEKREFFVMDAEFARQAVNHYIDENNIKVLRETDSTGQVNGPVLALLVVVMLTSIMLVFS